MDVLPHYAPRIVRDAAGSEFQGYEAWECVKSDSSRIALRNAFEKWADNFRISEDWIIQAALNTLQGFADFDDMPFTLAIEIRRSEWFWLYYPSGSYPHFHPLIRDSLWSPQGSEAWDVFRRRMESQFKRQLTQYRKNIEVALGVNKFGTLRRDAEWTARYHKGEAAHEIATALTGPYKDKEQAVYRSVERFARQIGLNIRKNQKRRNSK